MEIRSVAVDNERQFADYFAVMKAAELAEHDDLPFWTLREAAVFVRGDDSEWFELFGAYEDEAMVGCAYAAFSRLDNLDKIWAGVFVSPQRWRRGIGTMLVEHLKDRAAQQQRSVILADSTIDFDRRDDHPYRSFAEKHGFALASVEVARVLQLPVHDEVIQGWLDKADPHHTDYRLETHLDEFPDALVPSLTAVLNQLAHDAPTGDIDFEEEKLTPEVWKQRRAKLLEQGRHPVLTVALDSVGDVVAMTMLVVPPEDMPKAYQFATIVHRDHRGHRLGMAIKALNLRRLQELFPERTQIWTSNEETNGPMLDINVAMGFAPRNVLCCFQWTADER